MPLRSAKQLHQHVTGAKALLPEDTACPALQKCCLLQWLHQGSGGML